MKIVMTFLLSHFFDDYGFSNDMILILWVIIIGMLAVIFMVIYNNVHSYLSQIISLFASVLYLALLYAFFSINQFEHIPASGTEIQKANLMRCTSGKTVNLENIKDIMTDCKKRDQELEFKEILIGK